MKLRQTMRRWSDQLLTRKDISIISDDCWGAEFYRRLPIPYTTPCVGFYVVEKDYLNFLVNLRKPDAFKLEPVDEAPGYPVLRTPYATLHCMHYHGMAEAISTIERRAKRIIWDNLFIKIDLGKEGYTEKDVLAWNKLRFANSLAIVPASSPFVKMPIWNQVVVSFWEQNGASMFQASRASFDFPYWTRTGKIRKTPFQLVKTTLIASPRIPQRLKRTVIG